MLSAILTYRSHLPALLVPREQHDSWPKESNISFLGSWEDWWYFSIDMGLGAIDTLHGVRDEVNANEQYWRLSPINYLFMSQAMAHILHYLQYCRSLARLKWMSIGASIHHTCRTTFMILTFIGHQTGAGRRESHDRWHVTCLDTVIPRSVCHNYFIIIIIIKFRLWQIRNEALISPAS